MGLFNEKWNNSSILTKVAAGAMFLGTVLVLVWALLFLSWGRQLMALSELEMNPLSPGILAALILFILYGLYTFGLIKVNNFARIFTILAGLCNVIIVVMLFTGIRYVLSYAREAVGDEVIDTAVAAYSQSAGFVGRLFIDVVIPLIPPSILATIGLYIFIFTAPPVLLVLAMLILLFCGKDFKKIK